MPRCILFDLDGTLVDSVPDLAAALNRLLAARGMAPFDEPSVAAFVGDGTRVLVERAFAARGAAADDAAADAFLADYTQHASERTRPFSGVAGTLSALRDDGWRMGVCTNKPAAAARRLLADLDLAQYFAAVGGGDSFPVRKPDPGHLLATLREAGGVPEQAVMVGDHAHDMRAAAGARIPAVFAAWGYSGIEAADGAAAVAGSFAELAAIAPSLLPAG